MRWIQFLVDVLSLLGSANQFEIAYWAAWAAVVMYLIARLFGRGFGLMLLPINYKVLLVKFIATLTVMAIFVLHGHTIPVALWGLMVWITFNQVALIWWDRIGKRL